jgi:hypothetical protein
MEVNAPKILGNGFLPLEGSEACERLQPERRMGQSSAIIRCNCSWIASVSEALSDRNRTRVHTHHQSLKNQPFSVGFFSPKSRQNPHVPAGSFGNLRTSPSAPAGRFCAWFSLLRPILSVALATGNTSKSTRCASLGL